MKKLLDPVDIDENIDDGKFTDISSLVDKDKFLEDVVRLREEYKVDLAFKESYEKFIWRIHKAGLDGDFERDVAKLRNSNKRAITFTEVIKKTIVCNRVRDDDYSRAYLEEVPFNSDDPNSPEHQYAIWISPSTKIEDVKKVFQKFKNDLEVYHNPKKYKKYKKKYPETNEKVYFAYRHKVGPSEHHDTRPKLKAKRKWYWGLRKQMKDRNLKLKALVRAKRPRKEDEDKLEYKDRVEFIYENTKSRIRDFKNHLK